MAHFVNQLEKQVTISAEHALHLFDVVVVEGDLSDISRWGWIRPAVRALCEQLIAAGCGDSEVGFMTKTTPRQILTYLDESAHDT